MDLDISDILDSVSHTVGHPSLATFDPSTSHIDHQLLVRSWTSERCSPALLPYPTEVMQRIMSRIAAQIAQIEDLTAGGPESAAAASNHQGSGNQNLNLTLSILQTDLSRAQFIVRSLLRQRLAKITKHAAFYLDRLRQSDDKKFDLLSESEVQFLRGHQALLAGFYEGSFLDAFPAGLRKLDDRSGGVSMVEGPDGDSSVFVRCLGERWENEVEEDDEGGMGVELRMRRGEVWVVRWEDVRQGVLNGDLEAV